MKISAELIPATFLKRDNRFRVTVRVEGHPAWAHLPNSGRLRELLVPGRRVLLAAAQASGRLTSYDLLMVDLDGTLVSIDARLPIRLLYEALRQVYPERSRRAQDEALRQPFDRLRINSVTKQSCFTAANCQPGTRFFAPFGRSE